MVPLGGTKGRAHVLCDQSSVDRKLASRPPKPLPQSTFPGHLPRKHLLTLRLTLLLETGGSWELTGLPD